MNARRRSGLMIVVMLSLVLTAARGAAGESGPMLPAKAYPSYFVSNAHTLPPGKQVEYLYIDNFRDFNAIFGLAVVMHMTPEVVTEELFREHAVLAVIRDGLWNMRLDHIVRRPDGVELRYSAVPQAATFKAVTPLIVSVPKGAGTAFKFVENGILSHVIALDGVASARERFGGVPVAGGWTGMREVDAEAGELFKRALSGLTSATYEPLLFASQVVNGVNYRFICKQTRLTNPPVHALARVTFHVSLSDEISDLHIDGAGH